MSELTRDSALEFLADYITNNKINYVGGEFEREDNNERFLIVVSKESALKNLTEENQRLTAIATKHATRADELYEALKKIMPAVKQYLEYEHDGDPWTEDARSMGEMDLNELDKEGVIEELFSILDKSRIEAENGDGICN